MSLQPICCPSCAHAFTISADAVWFSCPKCGHTAEAWDEAKVSSTPVPQQSTQPPSATPLSPIDEPRDTAAALGRIALRKRPGLSAMEITPPPAIRHEHAERDHDFSPPIKPDLEIFASNDDLSGQAASLKSSERAAPSAGRLKNRPSLEMLRQQLGLAKTETPTPIVSFPKGASLLDALHATGTEVGGTSGDITDETHASGFDDFQAIPLDQSDIEELTEVEEDHDEGGDVPSTHRDTVTAAVAPSGGVTLVTRSMPSATPTSPPPLSSSGMRVSIPDAPVEERQIDGSYSGTTNTNGAAKGPIIASSSVAELKPIQRRARPTRNAPRVGTSNPSAALGHKKNHTWIIVLFGGLVVSALIAAVLFH